MTEKNEIVSMAQEICSFRGEVPCSIDRRGAERWEKYKPLAQAVLREAERLFALRAAAASAEPVAWRALCENTGGQLVMVDGLKDMLVERADSIYNNSGGYILQPLYTHPAPFPASVREAPTIDDVPSCGQENDYRRAR